MVVSNNLGLDLMTQWVFFSPICIYSGLWSDFYGHIDHDWNHRGSIYYNNTHTYKNSQDQSFSYQFSGIPE